LRQIVKSPRAAIGEASIIEKRRKRRRRGLLAAAALAVGAGLVVSSALAAGTPPSVMSPPTITGTAKQGQTLAASNGIWTGTTPMSFGYQWQRCSSGAICASIPGATAPSYTLASADVGYTVRVGVTGMNQYGSTTAYSSQTAAVASSSGGGGGTAPSNTGAPTLSGTAQQGLTLSASRGTWAGTTPMSYAYQWQRCTSSTSCSAISGATATSYTLASADVGNTVRVRVIASNTYGSATAYSSRTATVTSSSGGGGGGSGGGSGTTGSVVLVDQEWHCTTAVNLTLVKVTLQNRSGNPIYLEDGCTGRIDRIEVDTWFEDGVKLQRAHDLVIGGGYITCHARAGTVHQDGIQAPAGLRVTFYGLRIDCPQSPNAALFINRGADVTPTDVVCDGCMLLPANSTVNINNSVRSGVRNSTVCTGRASAIYIQEGAVDPVNSNNTVLPRSDPRCVSTA
jgi:hypothetical protein